MVDARYETAIHEAGHACVALTNSWRVSQVYVYDVGAATYGKCCYVDPAALPDACVALGGCCAQMILHGCDMFDWRYFTAECSGDAACLHGSAALLPGAVQVAWQVLRARWGFVVAAAGQLAATGYLAGPQVRALWASQPIAEPL